MDKHLYDSFHIQNGLKQKYALSLLLRNIILGNAIIRFQENQAGLTMTGTHQLLAYADDMKLQADNIDTIKRNTKTFNCCW
jgi:hypothetical protein